MTGRIIRVNMGPGWEVKERDILLLIDAMKSENGVRARQAGIVTSEVVLSIPSMVRIFPPSIGGIS
jgi:biotin carboxyl carrier protein